VWIKGFGNDPSVRREAIERTAQFLNRG
jgi:hypothetical protein